MLIIIIIIIIIISLSAITVRTPVQLLYTDSDKSEKKCLPC